MPEAVAPLPGSTRHFLTFRLDDRHYALSADEVAEIIRIPAVARMPQSPPGLMGLANLRGTVLPMACGRALLGQGAPPGAAVPSGRAVVLHGASPVGLVVDAVLGLVELAVGDIETRSAEIAALPGEVLQGAFRPANGGQIVKLLDIKALLRGAFTQQERARRPARLQRAGDGGAGDALGEQRQSKMVAFAVAGQEYALPLGSVQEIVAAPSMLAALPHSQAMVIGVGALRDGLLPLLSLRGLLGLSRDSVEKDKEKVVVTTVHGSLVGLVVDEMRAIFSADETLMDPIPEMLAARIGGESRVSAIYRGAHSLISILAPEQLFGDDVMRKLEAARSSAAAVTPQAEAKGDTLQFLVFRLGDEEFGLPIAAVDEVARVPETMARIPKTPKFLEGVINLRGEVLPVVDQRKRFNMSALPGGAARRLVVVRTQRHRAGLIVDSVSEVLHASLDGIEPAPDLTGEAGKLVDGVVNLEAQNRIVLLLDPAELLTRAERGLLDAFNKQQAAEPSKA